MGAPWRCIIKAFIFVARSARGQRAATNGVPGARIDIHRVPA
jgi:hypothetical protein